MKTKLTASGGDPADPVPSPTPVPDRVELAGSNTLLPATEQEDPDPTSTKGLANKATATFVSELSKPEVTEAFITSLSIIVQLALMHLRTPSTLKLLAHTSNAQTLLVPGIQNLVKMAPVIREVEQGAFRGVNLALVAERNELLPKYREILSIFELGGDCVEAGITHLEQYLDGVARKVHPRVTDLMIEDRGIARQLAPFDLLVTKPAQEGLESKKKNARLTAEVQSQTLDQVQGQGTPVPVAPPPAAGGPAGPVPPAPAAGPGPTPTPPRAGAPRSGGKGRGAVANRPRKNRRPR